ncbi:hypothetical protein SZ55_0383 [Pseudomonas sp. FeS53a]|nr:hypothetical protein SZ55_0383 [Pseudomonas sp. FeS53a]
MTGRGCGRDGRVHGEAPVMIVFAYTAVYQCRHLYTRQQAIPGQPT